jgi:diaminopimelate decarboxylase
MEPQGMSRPLLFALVACSISAVVSFRRFSPLSTRGRHGTLKTANEELETSNYLDYEVASKVRDSFGTPVFVYDEKTLRSQGNKALAFPNAGYGFTVRYAMKASPNASILKLFSSMGIQFDVSSGFEAERAMIAGIPASHLSLSSQELPANLKDLIEKGIEFNACSIHQLEQFGQAFPGGRCGIRFNPGTGSGGTGKTNVGGPSSSFGIWHELKGQVKDVCAKHGVTVKRIHTHIGSGSDPNVWQQVSAMSLSLVEEFPEATTLNLGGGFKVGRMSYEKENATDLQRIGEPVKRAFQEFAERTGRKLKLEIEPGTFLSANSGTMLSTIQDMTTTGPDGYTFLKLDSGMTDVLRPSLYGAQHPLVVLKRDSDNVHNNDGGGSSSSSTSKYVVVGHCCESGDLFSCVPGDPESLQERTLAEASIGDLITVEGSGGYCASMNTKNYNSFPEAPEVMIAMDGTLHLIRMRQRMEQMLANEVVMQF